MTEKPFKNLKLLIEEIEHLREEVICFEVAFSIFVSFVNCDDTITSTFDSVSFHLFKINYFSKY